MRLTARKLFKTLSLVFAFFFSLVFGYACVPEDVVYDPITAEDYLTAVGQDLYNAKGEKVLLNGVNLGGWLHFEGWMDGGGSFEDEYVNHYAVRSYLEKRFSAEQVEELLEVYQSNYITEFDLKYIRSLGLNFVRVPFFWTEILDKDGLVKQNAFDQLDWVTEKCAELGMYVLFDLHGSVGGHSKGCLTGGHLGSNELWTNEQSREWTIKLWQAIARRYKDNPTVYGYDLLNEPMPPEDTPITTREMYDILYDAVREVDDKHIIVLEAFWNCEDLGRPEENGWENVVYQAHMYHDADKSTATQFDFAEFHLRYLEEYKNGWNVAMLAGEYNFWSAEEVWRLWLNNLNEEGISWCSWTYKNTDKERSNNWGFYYNANVERIDYQNDSFEEIARKWRGYSTDNYEKNEFLYSVITDCAYSAQDLSIEIPPLKFSADAYATNYGDNTAYMFDGNLSTRWCNGEKQKSDGTQYVAVSFGEKIALSAVRILSTGGDYGRKYAVYYRDTQSGAWRLIEEKAGVRGYTDFAASGVITDKIKICQTGEDKTFFWSIHELLIYGKKYGK